MKYLNRYNNFLIKESITDIDYIKDLIDDYFLEYIENSDSKSSIIIDDWIDPKDFDNEINNYVPSNVDGKIVVNTRKKMSKVGHIPIYAYRLSFGKSISMDRLRSIKSRLESDNQLNIIDFSAKGEFKLSKNSDESTTVDVILIYQKDEPASTPEIITEISDSLLKNGYELSSNKDSGIGYYAYSKYDKKNLDPIESENLFPISMFDKTSLKTNMSYSNGFAYKPKSEHLQKLGDNLLDLYKDQFESEWNIINKILPNIPKPSFRKVYIDDLNRGVSVYMSSSYKLDADDNSPSISWEIYLRASKTDSDSKSIFKKKYDTKFSIISKIVYYDPNINDHEYEGT